MQKYGEIATDLAVAQREHLVRRRSNDDVICLDHGQAEQAVAYGAADLIDLHGSIIP
jgi:hypothetical protein